MLKNLNIMRGVNLGGWFSQCDYSEETLNFFITEDDFKKIAEWGADHVRIPVDYNVFQDENGNFKEDGFGRVKKALDLAKKYGLCAVLDLHKTLGYSFDSYGESESGFFENAEYQENFYSLWEKLAENFGVYSDMTAFELLNEVTKPEYIGEWNRIAGECIKRIRKYAPETVILVGSYNNNSPEAVAELSEPYDDKVAYNFHCYEPLKFTHQGAYWTDMIKPDERYTFEQLDITEEYFENMFRPALEKARENNTCVYCGEFGVIDRVPPEEAIKWFGTINRVFEKYGIARAVWCYKGLDFGISEERMDGMRGELLKYI